MKRETLVDLLASWAKPEILRDVYSNNHKEWADNLLYTLEHEYGIKPPKYSMCIATGKKYDAKKDFAKDVIDVFDWEKEG